MAPCQRRVLGLKLGAGSGATPGVSKVAIIGAFIAGVMFGAWGVFAVLAENRARIANGDGDPGLSGEELEKAGIRQLWVGTVAYQDDGFAIGSYPVVDRNRAGAEKQVKAIVMKTHPKAEILSLRAGPVGFGFVHEAYKARMAP